MKDDSSSDSDDLAAVRQWCEIQKRKLPPAPNPFTAKPGTNFKIDNISNVLDSFYKYFDDELIDTITTETNRYAAERDRRLHSKSWCSTSQNEIKSSFGNNYSPRCNKGTGSARLLQYKPVVEYAIFLQKTLSYRRFCQINQNLPFNNNDAYDASTHPCPKIYNIGPIL
ncbi:hypothetical protein AVEN_142415-1 [Araneus ventricosus]|uniref:PiggyBac transposable element-derived protein domain-containing protein n=1 Tax=Araneus ventricosus TaxID=182803 RepID=A0A4Y2C751_ARAVE|nr:hypothetical protein AVEN_142415-1 [Araneus ventricosus]